MAAAPRLADGPASGVLGDFRIIREVGRGGMGVVYEAEQLSLGRRVALKVLPFAATMDPRHLQRFQNEAQAAACLHHTNIVPVFSVGCERGVHFYAMQFIDGQTLAAVIQRAAPARRGVGRRRLERTTAVRPGATDGRHGPAARQSTLATLGPARGRDVFPARGGAGRAGGGGAGSRPSAWASCIATSSRATCCWTAAATCG